MRSDPQNNMPSSGDDEEDRSLMRRGHAVVPSIIGKQDKKGPGVLSGADKETYALAGSSRRSYSCRWCCVIAGVLLVLILLGVQAQEAQGNGVLGKFVDGGFVWLLFELRRSHGVQDCPTECSVGASHSPSNGQGYCREAGDKCSLCSFCKQHSPDKFRRMCPPREVSRCAQVASNRTAAFENYQGCFAASGARLHPNAQLAGQVLDAVCRSLQLAASPSPKMLVFSVGHDSPTWVDLNARGSTFFVEDVEPWIAMQPDNVRSRTVAVNYTTMVWQADNILCDHDVLEIVARDYLLLPPHHLLQARVGLGEVSGDACWDVILVDGPRGMPWGRYPGRMQSLFAAAMLSGAQTTIFVDDCDRRVEDLYMFEYLLPGRELIVFKRANAPGFTCMLRPAPQGTV